MSDEQPVWSFGELRAFFHADEKQTEQRFRELFNAMMSAHEREPGAVEEEWLPYALEMLEGWPAGTREWDGYVWWNKELDRESFELRSHPLHALGQFLSLDDESVESFIGICHAPDVGVLRSLDFFAIDALTSEALEHGLEGLKRANLEHLGLGYSEIDEGCAKVLAEATHLRGLVSLDIAGSKLSWNQLKAMLSAPHFRGLRHLNFGDVPGDNYIKAGKQLELMELLPELVTTLAPHNAVPWYRMKSSWEEVEVPAEISVKERVKSALSVYSDEDDMYPFLGDPFCCFGGMVELEPEEFWREGLTWQQIYPRHDEIVANNDLDITSIHVAAIEKGALDHAFDEDGNLIATLTLRALGHHWLGVPEGREEESYGGDCFMQSLFASHGLYLEQGEDGLLRLEPEKHRYRSSLMRFWDACRLCTAWVGGWISDYVCTPWYEPLGGSDNDVRFRATAVWEEREHRFDRGGELHEPQPMLLVGDGVPLIRVLRGLGFEVSDGRWDIALTFTDRRHMPAIEDD